MVNNCSIMVEATVALGLDANSDYRDGKMYAKPHASWIRHETWPRPTQVYRYKLIGSSGAFEKLAPLRQCQYGNWVVGNPITLDRSARNQAVSLLSFIMELGAQVFESFFCFAIASDI